MKVLHLSSERTWRGGEQQIAYLIEGSQKEGIECFVACKKNSAFEKYVIDKGIPYLSLGFKNEIDFITALRIKSFCKLNKIDIVHIHSSHSHAMAVWSAVLGNKSQLVVSRRVDFPVKNNLLSRFKFNYKGIKRIICISKKIEEIVSKDIKNKAVLRTVFSGIDLKRFNNNHNNFKLHTEFNLPTNTRIVANISAIAPHKDYPTFIQTAKKILKHNKNIHFFIIGDGPSRPEVEHLITENNLNEHITITGFRTDIPEIIKEVDVMLMTSTTEGLGTTILDAFANKVPVAATNGGGIPELVIHEKTGLLTTIKDSNALSANVIRILEDENLAKYLSEKAFEHLLSNFTIQQMALGNIKIYKELLSDI